MSHPPDDVIDMLMRSLVPGCNGRGIISKVSYDWLVGAWASAFETKEFFTTKILC